MNDDWRPAAPIAVLHRRADTLADIRQFFTDRGVREVETPLLSASGVTDRHIDSLREQATGRWLQTSPEYAMKRLLAAGFGDCYQITRAFRGGEQGRWHNPEFSILEWYRTGFDGPALRGEIADLVDRVLGPAPVETRSYAEAFMDQGLPDPLSARDDEVLAAAAHWLPGPLPPGLDREGSLDLLLGTCVVPNLPSRCFLTDYPASQAVLARLNPSDPRVAERFELFCSGVEIANGFVELTDATALRARFADDQAAREAQGRPVPAMDERLLAAMEAGLPACAGVAIGLDRLIMLREGAASLEAVMAFPWNRA